MASPADAQSDEAPGPDPFAVLAAAYLAGPVNFTPDGDANLDRFLRILGQIEAVMAA